MLDVRRCVFTSSFFMASCNPRRDTSGAIMQILRHDEIRDLQQKFMASLGLRLEEGGSVVQHSSSSMREITRQAGANESTRELNNLQNIVS
jgi:hypothetical protein